MFRVPKTLFNLSNMRKYHEILRWGGLKNLLKQAMLNLSNIKSFIFEEYVCLERLGFLVFKPFLYHE
jgi:hypothetical protein